MSEELQLKPTPQNALEFGKAAEHLVCADLILMGYRAFLSDQGLPYDVIVDLDGRLIRIQVKSTYSPRNVNSQGKNERIAYNFAVRQCGKKGYRRLSDSDCDIAALVALDLRVVAYLPISVCATTMQLLTPKSILSTASGCGWWRPIDQFPFHMAVSGDLDFYTGSKRIQNKECANGHPWTEENTFVNKGGQRICRKCIAIGSRRSYLKRLERKEGEAANAA